jgi:hypothetical protein
MPTPPPPTPLLPLTLTLLSPARSACSPEQSHKVQACMLDIMGCLVEEMNTIPDEILDVIFGYIISPKKVNLIDINFLYMYNHVSNNYCASLS